MRVPGIGGTSSVLLDVTEMDGIRITDPDGNALSVTQYEPELYAQHTVHRPVGILFPSTLVGEG